MSRDWLRQPIAKAGQIDQIVAQHIEARKDSGGHVPERRDSGRDPLGKDREPIEPPPHLRSETAPPAVLHQPPPGIPPPARSTFLGVGAHPTDAQPKSPGRATPPLLTPIVEERPPAPPPRTDKPISPRPAEPAPANPLPDVPYSAKVEDRKLSLQPPVSPRESAFISPRNALSLQLRKQSSGKGLTVSDKRATTAGRKALTRTISYDIQTDEEKLQRRQLYRSKSLPCIHTHGDPWGLRPLNPVRTPSASHRGQS